MAQAFDPNLLFSLQANQVPPDQAQLQAQAQATGISPYLLPNPTQQPPQQVAQQQPTQPAPANARPNMFMNAGASTPQAPHGLKSYLPVDTLGDGYKQAAAQARTDQQGNLDDIQKYINDLKSKGQGIDWSPLATLADSMNPGRTNLAAAAKEMAPMTADERDKMLANLQIGLAKDRNQASAQNLSALTQQMNYEKAQQQMMETARHNAETERVGYGRNEAIGGRNLTAKDTQSQHAGDVFDNNDVLKTALNRYNQIGLDSHTLASKNVTFNPAIMDEISTGVANALQGGKSASLEATKMQQINSLDKDWAKLQAYIADKPYNALSDDNKQQLDSILTRLHAGYGNIVAKQATNLRTGRAFNYNDPANAVMDSKYALYKSYGESAAPQYAQDVLDYAKAHSITPAAAQNVKDSRTKAGQ